MAEPVVISDRDWDGAGVAAPAGSVVMLAVLATLELKAGADDDDGGLKKKSTIRRERSRASSWKICTTFRR